MGLFSSKKKTKVYTATIRVVADDQIPDTPKNSTLKGIIRKENIAEHMVDGVLNSLPIKAGRMFRYAKKNYAYGLPRGSIETDIQGEDIVQQVISREVGYPVTLDYFKYSSLNSLHVGWKRLVGEYGYNSQTNELEVLSIREGVPVYLNNMLAVYTQETFDDAEPGDLDQWGTSPSAGFTPERPLGAFSSIWKYAAGTPYVLDPTAEIDRVEVLYSFEVELEELVGGLTVITKELMEGTLFLDVPAVNETVPHYHAKYTNPQGLSQYWMYAEGYGGYPEVDAIHKTDYDEIGTYFPFTYFRLDKKNRTLERFRDRPEYKTTKKMLSYLDMDYDALAKSIHQSPTIDDIEQALMIWAVPADTENEEERRYLFEYFHLLFYASTSTFNLAGTLADGLGEFNNRGSQAITIKDKAYTMNLKYQGISKRRVAGKIGTGKVGSHHSEYGEDTTVEKYTNTNGDRQRGLMERVVKVPYYSYRKQVNATFYEEIRVYNPTLTYTVWDGKNVVAKGKSKSLLIPLDHSITKLLPILKREILYSRSLHFVMNTRITTKEKWYQSGVFKIVMIIIAAVVTFFFPPGGAALWAGIIGAGIVIHMITALVVSLIINMVVGAAITMVTKVLGAEVAMVLAIALIAYGGYQGVSQGLSFTQTMATNVVTLGTNLVKASVSEYFRAEGDVLNKQTGEFELMVTSKNKELDEAKKLLDSGIDINPYEFVGSMPMVVWGESPKDLYMRTVESGNIGMATIEMVGSYVDVALTLPRVNTTLGFGMPIDD
jgi:hypothetical protein